MERKPTKICRACEPCRRRKVRCNGDTPCQHAACQSNPGECRYRAKARNRLSKAGVALGASPGLAGSLVGPLAGPLTGSLTGSLPMGPLALPLAAASPARAALPVVTGAVTIGPRPASSSGAGPAATSPPSPEQSVYDSITATHHAPSATDSSQLFYGPSSNFAFLHQVHRGTLQHAPAAGTAARRRDVQEGGPGLDMFLQRTLFFGTPSRVDAEALRPSATGQQIVPRAAAKTFLSHFCTVYLAQFPFFSAAELGHLLDDLYAVDGDPSRSQLLPQTRATVLAVLALGALCTTQTNTAEALLLQAKCQVVLHDDAVTLQMLQLSLLLSEYQLDMGRPNAAYLHLGVACRKAFALGLHKETTAVAAADRNDSADALQRQRATVWTLYCHETWLALVLGRRAALRVADVACAMPRHQPLLASLCRLAVIIESAAETIYSSRSPSLLQLYEKAERVHAELRQFADQVGIADAASGHYRSRFDDAASILLHNWYYHAVMLAFRPFLVADSALRSSGAVSHDDEMWLRHACRSAVSAAQDAIAFTHSMYKKPNAIGPTMRYCAFYFDAACSVLMHDTLYHPAKYSYNLEYVHQALECFALMVQDEPMTTTSSSIQKILQAVEKTMARQQRAPSDHPERSPTLAPDTLATPVTASSDTPAHAEATPSSACGGEDSTSVRWPPPMGSREVILFSDHPTAQPRISGYMDADGHGILPADHGADGADTDMSLPPNHFSNLNLDVLTTDLLNFFPVDITVPEHNSTSLFPP